MDTTTVPMPPPGIDMEELPPPQPETSATVISTTSAQNENGGQGRPRVHRIFKELPEQGPWHRRSHSLLLETY